MKKITQFVLGSFLILAFALTGCSAETGTNKEQSWEESATLVQEITIPNGQKMENVFRMGDNGKLGFGEYGPFIAGQPQKYMWHFWGDKETLTQPFKVIGVNKETGEKITVFEVMAFNNLAP